MQKHLLRDCEGFQIKDNKYTIQLWDENGHNRVDGLDAIYLYSSRFQMSAAMHVCDGNDLDDCNVSTYVLLTVQKRVSVIVTLSGQNTLSARIYPKLVVYPRGGMYPQ